MQKDEKTPASGENKPVDNDKYCLVTRGGEMLDRQLPGSDTGQTALVKRDSVKPPLSEGTVNHTPAADAKSSPAPLPQPPARNDGPFKPHSFHPRTFLINDEAVPTVYITPLAYRKMLVYVEIARKEVGWLGTVRRLPDGNFLIEDTYLLHQEVTAAETELSVEGQNRLTMDLIEEGDAGIDKIDRMRFWGHSHVYMGTSPSYTDDTTMLRFRANGLDWYIRGIFNKYGRAEFSVYLYDLSYAFIDAPWAVMEPETGEILSLPPLVERQFFFGGLGGNYREPVVKEASTGDANTKVANDKDASSKEASNKEAVAGATSSTKARTLPPQLLPDQALREEIESEFRDKVVERVFFSFFGSSSGNGPNSPTKDYGSQGGHFAGGRNGLDYYGNPTGEGYYREGTEAEPGWVGKAFAWLSGILKSSDSNFSDSKSSHDGKPVAGKSRTRSDHQSLKGKSGADKIGSDTE